MSGLLRWLVAATLFAPSLAPCSEELVDGIAAQVGTQVVLISEVMDKVADMERQLVEAGAPKTEIAKLRADGLERMIEEKILQGEVDRLELRASEQEIDDVISVLAADNGLTIDQLNDTVRSQGMTLEDYRAEIKERVEQRKVMTQALQPKVIIEEIEIRALFEQRFRDQPEGGLQVHLRHLLIPVSPVKDVATACTEATAAHVRIRSGEAFEAVAGEVSAIAPESGGDIGWLHVGSLAGWMSTLIADLPEGGISDVAQQPFGCNVLKLVERRPFEPVTFEIARTILEQELFGKKMEAEFVVWMEELREHTYIKRGGYFAEAAQFDRIGAPDPEAEEKRSLLQ